MPQRSGGFADQAKLRDHFDRHVRALGASTPADDEWQANNFLNGPPSPGMLEKTRANGDIARFDLRTDEFGVVRADGAIPNLLQA